MRISRIALNCLVLVGLMMAVFSPVFSLSLVDNLASAEDIVDTDGDGITSDVDNCPDVANADQADSDGDGIGDACEPVDLDTDADGVVDDVDNCASVFNPGQEDADSDGLGDACDTDADSDGVEDAGDNCPGLANSSQSDIDGDRIGDDCDAIDDRDLDIDDDGYNDDIDNCPTVANNQSDTDGDGIGDSCDPDVDSDGIVNEADSCPTILDLGVDVDADGQDDACDQLIDSDNDGLADSEERGTLTLRVFEVASESNHLIGGSCFNLYRDGVLLYEWYCDGQDGADDGILALTDLEAGSYDVEHVWAADGYQASPPVSTTVSVGIETPTVYDFYVLRSVGSLEIHATDWYGIPIELGTYSVWAGEVCGAEGVDPISVSASPLTLPTGSYCVRAETDPDGYELSPGSQGDVWTYVSADGVSFVFFQYLRVNTPTGEGVKVSGPEVGNLEVTFASVTNAGVTTSSLFTGTVPEGYSQGNATFVEISTTADVSGVVTVCTTSYQQPYSDPSTLALFHLDGSVWVRITTSNDPGSGVICGVASGLGSFLIAEEIPTGTLRFITEDWSGQPVAGVTLFVHRYDINVGICLDDLVAEVTTDGNGRGEVGDLADGEYCVRDAAGVDHGMTSFYFGGVREMLIIVGDMPSPGYIELIIADKDGEPIPVDELRSNTCLRAIGLDELGGGASACDADSHNPVMDGKIVFGGPPRIQWAVVEYTPPFGLEPQTAPTYDHPWVLPNPVSGETIVYVISHNSSQLVTASPTGMEGSSITFESATDPGQTTITEATDAPELPQGFQLDGALYFEIETTATFSGRAEICLTYDPGMFVTPASLQLLHYEEVDYGDGYVNGYWRDVTISNDATTGVICGLVSSFSPFAIALPLSSGPETPPMTIVGFQSPVLNGELNTVKAGSTVPLKFEVFQGEVELTDVAVVNVGIEQIACPGTDPGEQIDTTTSGAHELVYVDGHFQQNWKTPKTPGACYQVTVTTIDDQTIVADFKLK